MKSEERAMRVFKVLGTLRDELYYYIVTKDANVILKIVELTKMLDSEVEKLRLEVNDELEEGLVYGTTNSE